MIELKVYLDSVLIHKTTHAKNRITIGRSEDNDLILVNPHVSRQEAIIEIENGKMVLHDKSTNGILLDSQRVSGLITLPNRCLLEIFPFQIEYLCYREDETIPLPKLSQPPSSPKPEPVEHFRKPSPTSSHFTGLVGESQAMHQLYQLIQDVGDSPATILIRGEHGTGKELVARALHNVSQRHHKPFVPVNCAAIPLDLIESELFGYEKGAFTGAQIMKTGKIEEARGGTIFLDEIGELSMSAQAKILRFLQEKAIMRLGSAKEVPVDVRVITATNRDLEKAMHDGDIRADLYYRLRVVQLTIQPLRERAEDIPLLVKHFVQKITKELGLSSEPLITDEARNRLNGAPWPGNVRQLENVLYSAILRSRSSHLIDEPVLLEDSTTWTSIELTEHETPLNTINKQALLQVLTQHHWDTTKAAKVLKVSRGTIYYKMKKYGIEPPRPQSRSTSS
ncbi:sigma 54-interacting transcriptional regulator [Candidatus Nitrospira salsa]